MGPSQFGYFESAGASQVHGSVAFQGLETLPIFGGLDSMHVGRDSGSSGFNSEHDLRARDSDLPVGSRGLSPGYALLASAAPLATLGLEPGGGSATLACCDDCKASAEHS